MQIAVASVPAQETITRDNVTLKVDAVVYYRVIDPLKAIINVQNYHFAVSQVAQTSLRSVTGRSNMDQLLSEREQVNAELKDVIDAPTEGPWGVRVDRVEVKDISLPESMKRSMSRQAEAERERRARIIAADGEYQASKKLAQAATVMAADPAALQLRLLQTVVEVAAEKNSTLVMPFPVELLRFFDRAVPLAACPWPLRTLTMPGPCRSRPRCCRPVATTEPASPQADPQSAPLNGSRKANSTADTPGSGGDDEAVRWPCGARTWTRSPCGPKMSRSSRGSGPTLANPCGTLGVDSADLASGQDRSSSPSAILSLPVMT